ncbi:DUF6431 domain-containing protein [Acidiferrobacter sp.]|uniref:DUF6431 domain-containing protein n=1 Tax=Acidiferrobacter sp. TaxID=1872107 RepID=UPI00261BDE7A|nr:DUF6431 domain-containing protein [Acidiferrobacter sp.]
MARIVSGIATLHQHRETLRHDPELYRPSACPHCGLGGLWAHGFYPRKADRTPRSTENPVLIPRFLCRGCQRTCSRLPACIAPRRWYDWATLQRVLMGRLMEASVHALSRACALARTTVRRWWRAWRSRSPLFVFTLCSRFPEWGREVDNPRYVGADGAAFWRACLTHTPLQDVMALLDADGVTVP